MVAVGEFAFGLNVMVPGPLITVQVPVPTLGTAARLAVRVPHRDLSGPGLATGF